MEGYPAFRPSHISCLPVQSFINWINIPWQNSSWMRYFEHFRATSWVHIRLRFHVQTSSPCIQVWGDLHCKTRGYFSTADSSIDSRKNLEESRCCCCSSKKNLAVSASWVWDVLLMQLMLSIIWINFTQSQVRFKLSLDTFPPNKKCNKQMWFKSYINQILVISPPLFIFMVSPKTISGAFASSRLLAAGMAWARVAGSHESLFSPYSEAGWKLDH